MTTPTASDASASDAATAPFARYHPHLVEHLGPLVWHEGPAVNGPNRGFAVLYLREPDSRLGSAATTGLRFQKITVLFPQELCCTLDARFESNAHFIVMRVAHMVLEGGAGAMLGTLIPGTEPFAEGSEMVGVVCAPNPYAEEGFDVVHGSDGEIELQIITLIPASAAELELAEAEGEDALFELWQEHGVDLADLQRPSVC